MNAVPPWIEFTQFVLELLLPVRVQFFAGLVGRLERVERRLPIPVAE